MEAPYLKGLTRRGDVQVVTGHAYHEKGGVAMLEAGGGGASCCGAGYAI